MTRDLIAGKVAINLEDENWIHFTLEDLYNSIDDGYVITAINTQCVERVASLSLAAGQTYYNLRELISNYYRVFAIYNQHINQWVAPCAIKELQERGANWETHHGNVMEWSPLGCDYIAVYRKPTVDVEDALLVFYKAIPDKLAGTDVPEFEPANHTALVEYSTGDLFDQNLEYTKSQQWMDMFAKRLARIKIESNARSAPDRIYALACQYSQTHT